MGLEVEIRGRGVVLREALPPEEVALAEQPNAVSVPVDADDQYALALYGMGYLPPQIAAGMGRSEQGVRALCLKWGDWFPGAAAAQDVMHRLRLREAEVQATDAIQSRLGLPAGADGSPKLGEVARVLEVTAKVGRLAEEKAILRRSRDAREAMGAVVDVLTKLGGRKRNVIEGKVLHVGSGPGGEDPGDEAGGRAGGSAELAAGRGPGTGIHGESGRGASVGRPDEAYGEDSRPPVETADKPRVVGRQGFRRPGAADDPWGGPGGDGHVGEPLGEGSSGPSGWDDHTGDRAGLEAGVGSEDS